MKRLLALVCILILSASAHAGGKVYTLDECIQMAKASDPQLTRYHNAVKTAGNAVWTQAGNFLPSLSLSASYSKTKRSRTSAQITDLGGGIVEVVPSQPAVEFKGYSAGYALDYTLFDGLRNVWGYLGSKASKESAEYGYDKALSDLVYVVKGEYYFVLKAKRDLDVAQDAVKRSEELLKLFEEKYELGSASLSEVLKQRVQYGNDKLTLVSKDKIYKVALAELALTIGMAPDTEYEIADIQLHKEPVAAVSELIKTATGSHPSILSSEAELRASKYDVRHALGYYLPSVGLRYSKSWSHDTFDKLSKLGPDDNSRTLSIGVSLPIFDGFVRESNLSRAKVTLSNARATDFYAKNQVIKNIRDAYLGIKLAEETLGVTEDVERSASEDMQLVQEKYNLGAAALWELLDAQVSLKEAQFNKVKAEFDYNLSLAQLQNAIGE